MSKLNKDVLYFLFEELQDDSKSLFSCLMVNRLWCETIIPILWKNPWCYSINYYRNSSLYYIIIFYLTDDIKIKEFLIRQGIQLPQTSYKPLLFDYLSFCKSINVSNISSIIQSSDHYSQFLLQQEFYNILIRKCSELRYLDMRSIEHQLFYLPEARVRLGSLCELECETSIAASYFYGLAPICQNIQRLIIINTSSSKNYGTAKLIEVQKNLKYFEWKDCFIEECYIRDLYEGYFLALAEKANTLNHLIIDFQYIEDCNYTFIQNALSKLRKLKTLEIHDFYYLDEQQLKTLVYHDLEVFYIDYIIFNTAACMIKNSGRHLRKILFRYDDYIEVEEEFYKDSLALIRTIYENCPSVEYLSLAFPPSKEHFTEFKKLLKACQNLKSLLLVVWNTNEVETNEKLYKNGENLLKILIKSAPTNLREIRFPEDFKISLETLKKFFEKWKGRPALSILTCDPIYNGKDYVDLINKYKNDGVIKDFKYTKYEGVLYY